MSGILSSVERIFDAVITQEGRRQIASGEFKPTYVSLSDSSAIYESDTVTDEQAEEGVIPHRFVLEAAGALLQDAITLETDDSGMLNAFTVSGSQRLAIKHGQVYDMQEHYPEQVTGSAFASMASSLLGTSIDHFKQLMILKTPGQGSPSGDFEVAPRSFRFDMVEGKQPYASSSLSTVSIDAADSLFQDRRLSHIPNFQFLPPVQKNGSRQVVSLGNYENIGQTPITTLKQVNDEVNALNNVGYAETVRFIQTSKSNNLFCQLFEVGADDNTLSKLDVVDFGEFPNSDSSTGTKHIFFAGKVYQDSYGVQTFICMFILVFE